jgi:glyoxylase-like metal-dependent hydrolase (beta-lactamase superfamily II)
MSAAHSIPHPMEATSRDLVPSRYALRIGEIDVMVISDGVLPIPFTVMSTNVEPSMRAAWLDNMLLPDSFDWAVNVMVVRSGEQAILIDSGLGGEFEGFPRAGQLVHRLDAAGIDLAALTDIVLTHLHMDHVGGLLGQGVKERLRPDVRIHVAATEVTFWEAPDFSRTVMPSPIPDVLRVTAKRFLADYGSKIHQFDEEHQVAPGVVVRRTGGHTPGHSVVRVSSGSEALTFAGDALFPVAFDHPEWQNGFEHDPEEAVNVRLRLFRDLAATGELLVATHLSFPSVGRVAKDGDAYRWVPGYWDY